MKNTMIHNFEKHLPGLMHIKSWLRPGFILLSMLFTLGVGEMWAGAGWWDDGGVVLTFSVNGTETTRTLNKTSQGGTTSLGTVTTAITLKGAKGNVWKSGGNICSVSMYYRVKNSGGTIVYDKSGSATALPYASTSGSNQVWQKTNINDDLLNGGLAPGTYTFECWFTATGDENSTSGCGTTFWYSKSGSNYTYTFIVPSKNLTVSAGAGGSASGSKTGITKGTAYTITATPNSGYAFSGWTTSATNITIADASSATTTVTFNNYSANATVTAGFVAEETHDVTVYYKYGSTTVKTATTESAVGVSTPRSVSAPDIDGYTFSSWTKGSGITITSGTTSSATISITSGASGNTLTANYAAKSCNLYKFNAAKNGTGSSVGTMTFDESTMAYYKDVTTNSSPYYFRFNFNSGTYYSTDWSTKSGTEAYTKGKTVIANGDKVACDQNVTSWGDKPSIVFNGLNSSAIRIWFDYQNKKVWITEATYTVTINNGDHGTVSPNGSQSVGKNSGKSITATPATGYNFSSWSKTGSAVLSSTATNPTTVTATGTGTVTANYTAKTYTVNLNKNGGSGSTAASVTATYNSSTLSASITNPTRTGYNFNGWHKGSGTGQLIIDTNGALQASTDYTNSSSQWTNDGNVTLYAGWTAKTTTVSFSQSGEGYGSGGQSTTKTATYGAAMPTPITLPTAANGYAFMGYYDALEPLGTQYYTSTGTSARNWDKTSATTLYAYFKKAEIVDLSIEPSLAEKGGTVEVTPEIEPTPTGTTSVCYYLLYMNGNKVDPQPDFGNPNSSGLVSFTAPNVAGTFILAAALRTGSSCGGGTLLDSVATHTFQVGGEYNVTIKYMCGTTVIKEQTRQGANPVEYTSISAPDIFGYTFSTWEIGDGITKHPSDALTKKDDFRFTASYDGTITAIYTKKSIFYFKNTLGWSNVYVNFMSNQYWDAYKGSGNQNNYYSRNNAMSLVPGTTDIYYIEYTGSTSEYITFTSKSQDNAENFWGKNPNVQVVVPTRPNNDGSPQTDFGYHAGTNMFVPLNTKVITKNTGDGGGADYYNRGYWLVYDPITGYTGYTLEVYNKTNDDGGRYIVKEIPFTINSDGLLEAVVDLEAKTGYGIKFRRDDGMRYTNVSQTLTNDTERKFEYHPDNWAACGLQSTAAGNYVFTINCSSSDGFLYLKAHFPAAVNDFQVMYYDNAAWSGSSHASTWRHPSRIIEARAGGVDTISFFVAKNNLPTLYAHYAYSINAGTGAITWKALNIAGASSKSLTVDSSAVWNFKVTQGAAGVIASIENIGAYTGDYYIRCDAMNSKWDFYRSDLDHKMTYSAFSESAANSFGEKFSHYKAKWCPRGTNVKFVIANDYSPCISDTLIRDVTRSWPENMDVYGKLNSDGSADVTKDRWSANIRFMWNRKTNKISRAYVAASTNVTRKFLVLRGCDAKIHDHNNNVIPATTYLAANEVLLEDDQNWIYETTIKVQPLARVKLYACYGEDPASVPNAQYFRGAYDSNNCGSDANSIQILGGSGSNYYLMRVIYDFKTNRLITAWLPDGTDISGEPLNIDADVMVIRDHQQAAEAITFTTNTKSLGQVKTVYGTMRFNRWTLSNRYRSSDTYNPSFVPSTTETDINKEHCKDAESISRYHAALPTYLQTSSFERNNYFISFPFDVQLSEVFGFGTYGTHWIISKYNGLRRAQVGYFRDNCINGDFDCTNWDYIWDPTGVTLNAYEGYLLSLDLDLMQYDDTTNFWLNQIHQVELYFPSKVPMSTITTTNVTLPGMTDDYLCTKNYNKDGTNPEGDRRVKDSYWRCIGVPSYAPYGTVLKTGETEIQWNTDYTWYEDQRSFPFLYEWNTTDNTLTPQRTKTFNFKPLHSYLVQNKNTITWTAVSATPSSIVRRQRTEAQQEYTWRLNLTGDDDDESDTYIRMTDDEEVTEGFDFGPDMIKKLRDGYIVDANGDPIWDSSIDDYKQGVLHSDIYSILGYEYLAANSIPLNTTSTTIIPIGVRLKKAGEFTLSMPDGTYGVSITLVDNYNGTRTELGAGFTYTFEAEAGQFDDRFHLEIAKVKGTATGIENGEVNGENGVRKVMIDGILYLIRGNRIYDARGVRVE